jgi:DNA-damage-inducible protein J
MTSQMLHVRMDQGMKADGAAIFHSMGLTESEAVRMFYKRAILNHGLPFEMKTHGNSNESVKKTGKWSDFDGLLPKPKRIISVEEMNEAINRRRGEQWLG